MIPIMSSVPPISERCNYTHTPTPLLQQSVPAPFIYTVRHVRVDTRDDPRLSQVSSWRMLIDLCVTHYENRSCFEYLYIAPTR